MHAIAVFIKKPCNLSVCLLHRYFNLANSMKLLNSLFMVYAIFYSPTSNF